MKRPRVKLIDDSAFAIRREKPHERKPEAEFRSEKHRDWIRGMPCRGCGRIPPERATADVPRNQAAHLRKWTGHNKAGAEPDDVWLWPGCLACHRNRQHQMGEVSFWRVFVGVADPPRHILESYALESPCHRTREAAFEIYRERYG